MFITENFELFDNQIVFYLSKTLFSIFAAENLSKCMEKDSSLLTTVLYGFPMFSNAFFTNLTIKTIANNFLSSYLGGKPPKPPIYANFA